MLRNRQAHLSADVSACLGCRVIFINVVLCVFAGSSSLMWPCVCLQGLLQSHEKVETEVKAYNSEVDRLKTLSRKIVESSFSLPPTLVSVGGSVDVGSTPWSKVCVLEEKKIVHIVI